MIALVGPLYVLFSGLDCIMKGPSVLTLQDHKSGAGHIGTINIPPAAIGNPCHNKGPLRCPPLTPNPVTSIPHRNNCAKESNRLGTQGTFDSLWNVERILTPVGILVVMIWLGFVAVGLVAIVDYVWMRWGRRYSGYPGVEVVEVGDEERPQQGWPSKELARGISS